MQILKQAYNAGQQSDGLLIMLPGAWQTAEDLLDQGLAAELSAQAVKLDVWFADLRPESQPLDAMLAEIEQQVLTAAYAAGYRRLWLGGISLGGLLAMACAAHMPRFLSGLILLAPYPGNRLLAAELCAAEQVAAPPPSGDLERSALHWLQTQRTVPVYLGYGTQDRFAAGQALLASWLPARQVVQLDGGHDWPTWCVLWSQLCSAYGAEWR
jgi:pimeloyl-ACP methyl ester carboxylesterase